MGITRVGLTARLTFALRVSLGVGVSSAQHVGQRRAGTRPPGLARDVQPRAPLPGPVRPRSGAAPLRVLGLRLRAHFHQRVPRPRQSRSNGAHRRKKGFFF